MLMKYVGEKRTLIKERRERNALLRAASSMIQAGSIGHAFKSRKLIVPIKIGIVLLSSKLNRIEINHLSVVINIMEV